MLTVAMEVKKLSRKTFGYSKNSKDLFNNFVEKQVITMALVLENQIIESAQTGLRRP